MPGLSILIPHHSTPLNDAALAINQRMLRENTANPDCEVIVVHEYGDPYRFWNDFSDKARYEHLAFSCSDMLMAPGWDVLMQAHVDDQTLVTGYIVEPGVIPVCHRNIVADFGKSPERFDRPAFEAFSRSCETSDVRDGYGWYMPLMVTKSFFRAMGKYPCERPFPHPNDLAFWGTCESRGARFLQVRSFSYHFQNLSDVRHDSKRV